MIRLPRKLLVGKAHRAYIEAIGQCYEIGTMLPKLKNIKKIFRLTYSFNAYIMTAFEELGLIPELSAAVQEMEWNLPTDIQSEGIPAILGGADVLMAAETGSGKTGAFSLPIVQIVYETLKNIEEKRIERDPNAPMCIILEPTKELAEQTHEQINRFKGKLTHPPIRNVLVIGGISMGDQLRALSNGADIITCTPGRVADMVHHGRIDLQQLRFFVMDEADGLLSNHDNNKCMRELLQRAPKYLPSGERLQVIVCSATLHNKNVTKLADQHMHFPLWVDLKGQDSVPDTVHQVVCMVDPREDMSWVRLRSKPGAAITTDQIHNRDDIRPGNENRETLSEAVKILKGAYVLKAIEAHKMEQGVIFCRTRVDCDNMEAFLKANGHTCVCLHSSRNPNERAVNLQRFRDGTIKFLICTDVAARGLDVRGIPYVINVTLPPPEEKANYVHRIGRVGRAQRMGLAISLVSTVSEKVWYHQCKSRGVNCTNTELTNHGGCAKWYTEMNYLGEIEDALGITINRINPDFAVPVDEYDGKVVYGTRRKEDGVAAKSHAVELSGVARDLHDMERNVQLSYLQMFLPAAVSSA